MPLTWTKSKTNLWSFSERVCTLGSMRYLDNYDNRMNKYKYFPVSETFYWIVRLILSGAPDRTVLCYDTFFIILGGYVIFSTYVIVYSVINLLLGSLLIPLYLVLPLSYKVLFSLYSVLTLFYLMLSSSYSVQTLFGVLFIITDANAIIFGAFFLILGAKAIIFDTSL